MFTAAARSFARAAPRIATRSLSTTTRRARAIIIPARPSILTSLPRCFSTSISRHDAASQELSAKLESELQLESSENNRAILTEDDVAEFLNRNAWQLSDIEGEQTVKLTKSYDDETIVVQFSVADFPAEFGEDEEMDDALLDEEALDAQSGGANSKGAVSQGRTSGGNVKVGQNDKVAPGGREELLDEEDEPVASQSFPASVSVTVTRKGKQDALRFELVAEDGDVSIQSIAPLPSAEAETTVFPGNEKFWVGPPFSALDEELQSFFENYLGERGINPDLAIFVVDYIDLKEQREYLAWLQKCKQFLD